LCLPGRLGVAAGDVLPGADGLQSCGRSGVPVRAVVLACQGCYLVTVYHRGAGEFGQYRCAGSPAYLVLYCVKNRRSHALLRGGVSTTAQALVPATCTAVVRAAARFQRWRLRAQLPGMAGAAGPSGLHEYAGSSASAAALAAAEGGGPGCSTPAVPLCPCALGGPAPRVAETGHWHACPASRLRPACDGTVPSGRSSVKYRPSWISAERGACK